MYISPKKTLNQRFGPDIRAELDRFLGCVPSNSIDFEALETAVRRSVSMATAPITAAPPGPDCGQPTRYVGRPACPPLRTFRSGRSVTE